MSDLNLDQIRDLITQYNIHALRSSSTHLMEAAEIAFRVTQEFAPLLVDEVSRLRDTLDSMQRDLESERRKADRCERKLDDLHRQHELPRSHDRY